MIVLLYNYGSDNLQEVYTNCHFVYWLQWDSGFTPGLTQHPGRLCLDGMVVLPAERQHPAGLECHPTRYSICLNWCQYSGPFPHRQDSWVQEPRAGDENGPFRDFPGGPVGLRLHASNAGGSSSTPGWRTKISHFTRPKKKKEKKRTLSRNMLAEVKENREWKV